MMLLLFIFSFSPLTIIFPKALGACFPAGMSRAASFSALAKPNVLNLSLTSNSVKIVSRLLM